MRLNGLELDFSDEVMAAFVDMLSSYVRRVAASFELLEQLEAKHSSSVASATMMDSATREEK